MTSGELNYPATVLGMVADMQKTLGQVNQEMQTLGTNVSNLAGSSKSQAVGSYQEVHHSWNQLMSDHNRVLNDVAIKTRQGYDDMIAFDQQSAKQIQGH
ncbi:MAG TPA: hypothetical protein VGM75_14575 [Pseudonocardiaceae bacterium]|jgi:uncharacterized protein YukE